MPESLNVQNSTQDEERLSPAEIRMTAVALVAQMPMPMQLEDALAILDYARIIATGCLSNAI